MSRIAVAVSGGVDSAVAAARLVDAGHEVTAVHLALDKPGAISAAWQQPIFDAQAVARALGVPFQLWDFTTQFRRLVTNDFIDQYSNGKTPNPCLVCNKSIKFGVMLDRAMSAGFDSLATGHYAQLVREDGVVQLHRASDTAKDQSYVLGVLTQEQLQRACFPLGASTKSSVRAEAKARNLPVARKAESMDLCFIPNGNTGEWLTNHLGSRPGYIIDQSGTVLGEHNGTHLFTIGQRKGMKLRVPADDGEPRFVLDVDAQSRQVIVGPRAHLVVEQLEAGPADWLAGQAPTEPFSGLVQVRAHGDQYEALISPRSDGGIDVDLITPIRGVAPGQTAVVYDGTNVVVSATINRTSSGAREATM